MNARLMATCTIGSLALAAFALAQRSPAQSGASGGRGVFSSLHVGQMVQYQNDLSGSPLITTYEDEENKPLMRHKVREIGGDYLSLEYDDHDGTGAVVETRIPAYRLSALVHMGKTTRRPVGGETTDSIPDKPSTKTTKPGTTKKKN